MLHEFRDETQARNRSVSFLVHQVVKRVFQSKGTHSFLKQAGATLTDREQLTSLVIAGNKISKHS